ncbi:MAG: inner membrane-spanning protein YciB [Pseudomonadota bacterium]|nr:inner membrane-spanning protein YciB [Pseudomonadota bacterium]
MQAFIDFLPVLAFVLAYWITGEMKTAIIVIMLAVAIQIIITWASKREINRMLGLSALLVFILGGISLAFDNPIFFKWKPTGLYWLFALVLLGSHFIGKEPLVKKMLQSMSPDQINMPMKSWYQLNLMWVVFFAFAGFANIYVAYSFNEATWVNFKLFGLLGLTLIFLIGQAIWINKKAESINDSDNG